MQHSSKLENFRPWPLLLAWVLLCLGIAFTLLHYSLGDNAPVWDSLAYQVHGLDIAHLFLDQRWTELRSYVGSNLPLGHLLIQALGYLVFGFNRYAPHLVGGIYAFAALVAFYQLARELKASAIAAFSGALIFALLPNFFYQNFLETRNDYPLAACMAFAWVHYLRALRGNSTRDTIIAGIWGGLGTLIKTSAPGYFLWGMLLSLIPAFGPASRSFAQRLRFLFTFALSAAVVCGWHYLPALPKVVRYHKSWSQMGKWQAIQYALTDPSSRWFFYLRNLWELHLGPRFGVILIVVAIALLLNAYLQKPAKYREQFKNQILKNPDALIVFLAGVAPLFFITLTGSLASIGDIPSLVLLGAFVTASFASLAPILKFWRPWHSFALAVALLSVSVSSLSFVSLPETRDARRFASEVQSVRESNGLLNQDFAMSFSHPYYNIHALNWFYLLDKHRTENVRFLQSEAQMDLIIPEDPAIISEKLSQFPMLILSEQDLTGFGGEKFETFNRLQPGLNQELLKLGQYKFLKRIWVENHQLSFDFYLKKNP